MQTDEITRTAQSIFADPTVNFVAFWQDTVGDQYVQGFVDDGSRSLPGQVLAHLTEFDIPRPDGSWFLVRRDRTYQVID